ncbi:hypothetical protein COCCADRAFT_103764, partial [Bipolaris zeicola 26-R-13]
FLCIAVSPIHFLPKKNFLHIATRSMSPSYLSRSMKKNIIVFLYLATQAGAKCIPILTCGHHSDPWCRPGKANTCNWYPNIDKLNQPCPSKHWKCYDGECYGIWAKPRQEPSADTCFILCCESESDYENM